MKKIIFLLVTLTSVSALADLSASVESTGDIGYTIENKTYLRLSQVTMQPYLSCRTTMPQSGGVAYTKVAEAELNFESNVWAVAPSLFEGHLSIRQRAEVSAPEKEGVFDSQNCSMGAHIRFEVASQESDTSISTEDYFVSPVGDVSASGGIFKPEHNDFTKKFADELQGAYQIKMIDGGETWCESLGQRCSICALGLFKEQQGQLKYKARAMKFEKENCQAPAAIEN